MRIRKPICKSIYIRYIPEDTYRKFQEVIRKEANEKKMPVPKPGTFIRNMIERMVTHANEN